MSRSVVVFEFEDAGLGVRWLTPGQFAMPEMTSKGLLPFKTAIADLFETLTGDSEHARADIDRLIAIDGGFYYLVIRIALLGDDGEETPRYSRCLQG